MNYDLYTARTTVVGRSALFRSVVVIHWPSLSLSNEAPASNSPTPNDAEASSCCQLVGDARVRSRDQGEHLEVEWLLKGRKECNACLMLGHGGCGCCRRDGAMSQGVQSLESSTPHVSVRRRARGRHPRGSWCCQALGTEGCVQGRLAMLMVMYFFDKSCFLEQQLVLIKARSVGSVPAPDDAPRLVADSS